MIYIYKQQGKIFISENKRSGDKDDENYDNISELLYIKQWNDIEKVYKDLRYYEVLKDGPGWYKNCSEVKNYISKETNDDIYNTILAFVYEKDIKETIDKFQEILRYLISIKVLQDVYTEVDPKKYSDLIKYKCDVINILYDIYGTSTVGKVRKFQGLSETKKQFIKTFYNLDTRESKSDYIKNNINRVGPEDVQDFLPEWYNLNLRVFKVNPKERNDASENPEYNDSKRIDGQSKMINNQDYFVKQEVYNTFNLGEVWEGGKIKEELNKIYDKYGVPKNSRVHDIFNFFETSITRKGYRLITRKLK